MSKVKGWRSVQIEDCAKFTGGSQPPRSTFRFKPTPGYVRMLQIRDYKSDDYATYIPEKLNRRWCQEDDIMIGRYGPPIFQILRGKSGSYNVALVKAEPKPGTHKEFLYYLLRQDHLYRLIDRLSSRTSGQTGIDMDALNAFPVELPPMSEQQHIAGILGTWDGALEKLDALIAAKARRKQGLVQQLLTGKRRLPQFDEHWRWLRLDELCGRIERKAPVGIDRVLSITAGVGFQDQREKFSRVIAGRNIENYIHLKRGEFSYNKGNSNLYPQGCIYRLEEYDEGAVPNVWISFAIKSKDIDSNFLKQYFIAGGHNHQLSRLINYGVRNDGLLNLTAESFFSIKIPVPPLTEQQRLGELFEGLAEELRLLRNERAALDEQKRGLMQLLLTGKKRVSVG